MSIILEVAHALGVVAGIVESEYDLSSAEVSIRSKKLHESLTFLKKVLIEDPIIKEKISETVMDLNEPFKDSFVNVVISPASDAWEKLSLADLLRQAAYREIGILITSNIPAGYSLHVSKESDPMHGYDYELVGSGYSVFQLETALRERLAFVIEQQ